VLEEFQFPRLQANFGVIEGIGAVGHKSHDPCYRKKYMKAGVMTFVAHCTTLPVNRNEV